MIAVGNVLLSEDILEKKFVCELSACHGACCVAGDSGAPLREDEIDPLEESMEVVMPYLPESGKAVLKEMGAFEIDNDGDLVTPLVDGKHCAYTVFDERGSAHCGVELAWKDGKTRFRKPLSCQLYPIRVLTLSDGTDALNYHRWDICAPARVHGQKLGVPVYVFLKDALIRAYGEAWYAALEETAEAWLGQHPR